jgi:hypothetical protein
LVEGTQRHRDHYLVANSNPGVNGVGSEAKFSFAFEPSSEPCGGCEVVVSITLVNWTLDVGGGVGIEWDRV